MKRILIYPNVILILLIFLKIPIPITLLQNIVVIEILSSALAIFSTSAMQNTRQAIAMRRYEQERHNERQREDAARKQADLEAQAALERKRERRKQRRTERERLAKLELLQAELEEQEKLLDTKRRRFREEYAKMRERFE